MRRLPTSINTNTYRFRKVAVTTTKKSQATMTLAWLWMKVSQRCLGSGVRAGPPSRRYFSTVRGETRIPSFSFSSLAMRSSPQVAFSAAISRISRRRSLGRRGRPMGLDFQRQNSRNPWRCQRMSVDALTFTSASRHGNMRLKVAIIQRVESLARRGLTWRSWKSASCLRRKRFSAASARREWTTRMARRIRSITTGTIVRKQCATVRKSDEPDINSQHGTLQNVTGPTTAAWQEFLRTSVTSEGWHVQWEVRPTRAKVRIPVAWIAFTEETKWMKPIDKAIFGMVSESSGRNGVNPEVASLRNVSEG